MRRLCWCALPRRGGGLCGRCGGELPPYPTEGELARERLEIVLGLALFYLLGIVVSVLAASLDASASSGAASAQRDVENPAWMRGTPNDE